MKKFSEIIEARGDTAVFTFGRFNPPTTGHEKLMEAVAKQAKKNSAPYYIFASHSENAKKDPLPYAKKLAYMKKMFPKHARSLVVDKARNVFEIAVTLHNKGHKSIIMVVGSDRVSEFDALLNKYNGTEARHGYYGFDNIEVVSAGERDPDAEGVTGMSASKMRAAAVANDFDQFKLGLPSTFKQGMSLFKDVRKYMGVRESFVPRTNVMTDEDVVRDLYVEGKLFSVGDIVEDNYTGVSGVVVRRGTNYITFKEEDGTLHKKWLYEVKQDKDIKDRKGTEPAKYYAKDADGDAMSKSTKQKRAAHFAKKKDGPAPGDGHAETKPSKSTKKFKDMFGEEDPCWDTHKQVGTKKKNGKEVPNCVPKEEFQLDEKIEGLVTKAEKSGVPYGILKKVYDRGMAAWKTGHRPGTTPQQWAFARVNSFLTGGKTRTTADADLWKQAKGKKEESGDSREIGTDASRQERQKMTPGQNIVSFKEHLDCGTPDCCNECAESSLIESNQYRVGSEKYYEFFNEKRSLYERGELSPVGFDKELLEGDIGKYDTYNGEHVPLDCPMMESEYQGKDVELNKPKVGGSKKYYVYVKDGDKVKKVSWGDTSGLKVKLDDKEARKSFAARHDCANKKDKTTAGYWACNLPRYAKQLGLSGGGNFFW
ncbi:hypothetical protein MelnitzEXVC044M_18 [Methylophilales phage Melnitz EXVC044M]|nr:hypothetical protein Melnitz1EXVC043M_17 [Methylophilales phage Melnitz-1 EXVC043M]QZI94529.1 hypothetical protein Melnitz2EXVC040M_18 [Methylophilales phage Melnitz-2 EXVC040M]QZI94751.1 hypothetical protein MelnitzEXVC044M_18 [Methylophilales phage Melnitz EXVC044M]QZI94972.1 hypothetical protein Melnitz3EXVC039M_18 [Methylophilales phage Melnitz-3 EXVC039M]